MRDNVQTYGNGPIQDEVHLGRDGQLWVWDGGQVVVASSGDSAVQYALERGWPERWVKLLRAMGRFK